MEAFPAELNEIQQFLAQRLASQPSDIAKAAAQHFGISRQAVNRHLRNLVGRGFISSAGETRGRRYELRPIHEARFRFAIDPDLQEDVVWRDHVAPGLRGVRESVVHVCHYGLTEIVNNAIDHSASRDVRVSIRLTIGTIDLVVSDSGIGIFRTIKEECHLEDERHAVFELTKGKLTTDPERHTGEGIFFTSRMFDRFSILSGTLFLGCGRVLGDWVVEDRAQDFSGTDVMMHIDPWSTQTAHAVFERYAHDQDDYAFARTQIVVRLVRAGGDSLVSRSQAKRVTARLDRFREIVLDFEGVEAIGPAFADEIFRVFKREHPAIRIRWVSAGPDVERMIRRALAAGEAAEPT